MATEPTNADLLKAISALASKISELRSEFDEFSNEMRENWRRQAESNDAHIENMKRVAGAHSVRIVAYPNQLEQRHG